MTYGLSPRAEADLASIADYVAQDSPAAAVRLIGRIEKPCSLLGESPMLGRLRPEIAPGARSWAVGRYLILYRQLRNGVEIVRVTHGARDLGALDV